MAAANERFLAAPGLSIAEGLEMTHERFAILNDSNDWTKEELHASYSKNFPR
jgi:hypothetical protein